MGYAGSVNDSRIFRNSDLWMSVEENRAKFFPENEYIIADKAYPVLSWCIPPYINKGTLTQVSEPYGFFYLSYFYQLIYYSLKFLYAGSS